MVFSILFIFSARMSLLNIICISATPTQPTEVDYGGKIAFFRRKISRPDDLRARPCWKMGVTEFTEVKIGFQPNDGFRVDPRQLFRPYTSGPKIVFAEFVFYNRKRRRRTSYR